MRAYSAAAEETLRARRFLKDWVSQKYIDQAQYSNLEAQTVSELRTTNVFLRIVLVLFTLIIVGAATGLFFVVFLSRPSDQTTGIWFLIFAPLAYAAAEVCVSEYKLHRYGIEEALAACSVGFLCAGTGMTFFKSYEVLIFAVGAAASLWIWHRFGLWYAFLAAMVFVPFMPHYWTSSHSAQHLIVALTYGAALLVITTVRPRHRFDYLNEHYALAEALLWLGIYLAINLQLSSLNLLGHWWGGPLAESEFSPAFYWTSWVLTWCIPPVVLTRGVFRKDRLVIVIGAAISILTLVTNKPYLGWTRHTWDPMLLGTFLFGGALFLRRWLASAPGGARHGFTAERLSAQDKRWMAVGASAVGFLSPHPVGHGPETAAPKPNFGGGDSGGGGASNDF